MERLTEFFQDSTGGLSMSRLLCFMSFFPATYALIRVNSADGLLYYLGAYAAVYVGGKGAEYLNKANGS